MNTSMQEPSLGPVYKRMQLDFLTWAADWVRNETEVELATTFDLPDVVNVLQALGYRIRDVGQHTGSPLRGGHSGARAIIMCSHSQQSCVLEQPSTKADCTCVKKSETDPDKDAIWEVTATTPKSKQGLVETGGGLIPPITREGSSLMRHVMNYLLVAGRNSKLKDNVFSTPNSTRVFKRADTFVLDQKNFSPLGSSLGSVPVSNLETPSKLESPAWYRSLDTLTSKDGERSLPEPGSLLPKIAVTDCSNRTTQSSPNIKIQHTDAKGGTVSTIGEPSFTSKALNLIKGASESLAKAIAIIETFSDKKNQATPNSAFEEKMLLASKNIKKLICTSKPPPSTSSLSRSSSPNLTRSILLSVAKPRLLTKSESYTLPDNKLQPRTRRVASESTVVTPEVPVKRKDKYSHIKSTIPKASDSTKK